MNFGEFYRLLEMGMANISQEDSEVITIRNGSKIKDDFSWKYSSTKSSWTGRPIYISIYKDSSLNSVIASAEIHPITKTNYYNLHIDSKFIGKGYGPLLYEIAIEYLTTKRKSLISSTAARHLFRDKTYGGELVHTSDLASNVYKKFYERNDIIKRPLQISKLDPDDERGEDFDQSLLTRSKMRRQFWQIEPWLYFSYQKQPTTIQNLKSLNKLFIDQEINKIHDFIHSSNIEYDNFSKDHDMRDLIDYFIKNNSELEDLIKGRSTNRRLLYSPSEEINKINNLIYAYIRRFFQIKDQDYVKEKNILKYSWKELIDIVDYRNVSKLF